MIVVTLTAQNLGPDADEKAFDDWAAYVANNIDEASGVPVYSVDQYAFTGRNMGGSEDTIEGATDEQRVAIREALEALWERGCAENFGVAP